MLMRGDARALPLKDACVNSVVTSPPYWGLRDYGSPSQIGLEPTPAAYVASLVTVFREVWRVLRDDGTAWLNLGDSYAHLTSDHPPHRGLAAASERCDGVPRNPDNKATMNGTIRGGTERTLGLLKPKDLCGIPWRVAFALQADGWYLRSDIIWSKPNPMPESVTDRCTKSHEYLFMLTKSERYYFDADAIAEPASLSMLAEVEQGYEGLGLKDYEAAGVQNPSTVKARIIAGARLKAQTRLDRDQVGAPSQMRSLVSDAGDRYMSGRVRAKHNAANGLPLTRNKRSVWEIPTQPYAGAHFATFPEALVEPCILAGCPLGGLVLDPFIGSGTVGAVAERLGRRWVGVDLAYQDLAETRTQQRGLRFVVVVRNL